MEAAAKILLVEDNPGDARLIREAVSGIERTLTHVTSLGQAIAHVSEAPVDLVLLDLGLGDASGLQVVERMRAATHAPIVILTADDSYEVAMKALDLGADDFIVKSEIHESTVERVIGYTFERRELRAELERSKSRFQALVENSFDAVLVVDATGTVIYASPGGEKILGIDPGSQIGQNAFAHVHPEDIESTMREVASLTASDGATAEIEVRARHADGTYRWVSLRGRNLLNNEAIAGIVVNFHDVTDRKNQEEARRQADGRLRTLLRDVPAVIYTAEGGPSGRWYYVSPQIEAILGFSPQEWLDDPGLWGRQLHPEDAARVHLADAASSEATAGHPVTCEYRMFHRDGRVVWVRDVASVLPNAGGIAPHLFQGVLLDVTHEKKIEADLRESHETYRALVQNSSDMVSLIDDHLKMVYASPSICRISGFDEGYLHGRAFSDGLHPEDVEMVEQKLQDLLLTQQGPVELLYRRRRADGQMRWIDAVADCYLRDGQVAGLVVNSRDTTETLEAERARRESEELTRSAMDLFQGAFTASRTGIALIDAERGSYVDVNEALCEMLGYSKDELLALDWVTITHPEDREKSLREVSDFLAGRDEVSEIHKRYVRKDGSVISVEISDALVWDTAGNLQYFVTHVTDVTEREAAAKALRESQELLQAVVDNSPAVIYIKRSDGRYALVNHKYLEIFQLAHSDVIGKTDADIFGAEIAERLAENDARVFAERAAIEVEEQVPHSDGELHTYISVKFPLVDQSGESYSLCGISTDITERVKAEDERTRLEEQLRQSQKMEAVGQLAGGIAHDFNNLLAVILNYALFVSEDIGPDHPNNGDVDEIVRAAELGGALTRQLLTFSRKEIRQPIILELNEVISGMERLLSRTIRESISLKVSLEAEPWPIVADAGHVEQILMNLAVNAKDAMPTGGTLSIETRNVFIDEAYAAARPGLGVGEYACLAVSDTGCGMDEETRRRIFEPFFTTKPKDRGTGLGLATVYGIVKQSGGYITCHSEAGVGTTFKAYFPRSTADRMRPSLVGKEDVWEARDRVVLLVEDEDAVRKIGVRILENAGYTVHAASSGDDALSRFGARQDEIDLLVTDVVMPGNVSGKALSELLGCATLFVSGYTDNIIAETGGLLGDAFLQKPFSAEGLLGAVGAAIKDGTSSNDGHQPNRSETA